MEDQNKRSLFSKILLFAGMFVIPAFFILFFLQGTQNYFPLLYHGDHKIDQNGDTTSYYTVPAYTFYNEKGEEITEKNFENKILIVNYVFRGCPNLEVCPMDFKGFQRYIGDEMNDNSAFEDVFVLSHFEADADTLPEMIEFISDHNINTEKWNVVTGDMGQIYNTTINGMNPWTAKDTIYGYDRRAKVLTLLIDRERHIRGVYHTRQLSEITRITKEISILLREERDERRGY
ncbi:MAG: protein SCO1/2 [Flavobacteriales bacterium]|jgi:protein SCO1/2